MILVRLAPEVFVDPNDVSSIEHDVVKDYRGGSPSDTHYVESFNGTRITLKNGRKVFLNHVMPTKVIEQLGLKPIVVNSVSEVKQ